MIKSILNIINNKYVKAIVILDINNHINNVVYRYFCMYFQLYL